MKFLFFLLAYCFLFAANAQKKFITEKESDKISEQCPPKMDKEIYHKFIKDEISYTVLNQNGNVSGLKFDLGKTELSGTYRVKTKDWNIGTFEFSAGLNSDGFVKVLNNEKINTKINLTYNIHLIPNRSAVFNSSQWLRDNEFEKCQAKKDIKKFENELKKVELLLFSLGIIAKEQANHPSASKQVKVYEAIKRIIFNAEQKEPLKTLFLKIDTFVNGASLSTQESTAVVDAIKKFNTNLDGDVNIADIYRTDSKRLEFDNAKIYAAFKEKIFEYNNSKILQADFVIEKFSPFHTEKRRTWFTISPTIGVVPIKILDKLNVEGSKNITSLGVKSLLNFYKLTENSVRLSRIGINVGRISNLSDLKVKKINEQTFTKKNDSLFVLKETITKQGYEKDKIQNDKIGVDISYEFFMLRTKKTFIPGSFLLVNYTKNTLLQDPHLFSAELGLVFNVTAQDNKTKVYLLPYIGFPNFMKVNTDNTIFQRDWFLGLKVGLPFKI